MDFLKDFDALTVLVWVVPGAFITLFRSFAMRGAFPKVGKDDFAVFALGSVIYYYIVVLFGGPVTFAGPAAVSNWYIFFIIILIPAIGGFLLGLLEASDLIGRVLRRVGIRLPSPDDTAWETLFRDMPAQAVLLVTLKDGNTVTGRWVGGRHGSASSSDPKIMDLYIAQIGAIDAHGAYAPHEPQRGAYIAPGEIRFIEVISV